MIRKQLYLLYIIICVLSLLSCADNTHEEALCQAEALMEDERYEEAYVLLDSIDGGQFLPGSHQQARYALLYTKAQFKNYIDSDNDSLITLAVDYAEAHGDKTDKFYAYLYQGIVRYLFNDYSEASVSLIRSIANADEINDHYAKGQMYTYLAMVNGVQQCRDEDIYAQMAYREYLEGGLDSYANSTMVTKAVAKLHILDYDSALYWIDTCLFVAEKISNQFTRINARSIKAKYAILVDSLEMAQSLYKELAEDSDFVWTSLDYENLAYLYAVAQNKKLAYMYLDRSRELLSSNNQISFWGQSVEISRLLADDEEVIMCQDSLIYYQDKMLGQALIHASNASQRDYAEWQLTLEQTQNRQNKQLLVSLFLCFLLLCFVFLQYYRKKSLQVQLQAEKIEKFQLQIKQHEKDMANGLQIIKSSDLVGAINKMLTATGTPHVDWDRLYALYCEKLPLFEKTLRELSPLSEIEWRVCMLLKLGYQPSQIAFLTNKSVEAISSIRRRLYYKVFQQKGKAAEWDKIIEKM